MLIKFNKKFLISIIIVVSLISVAFTGIEIYYLNAANPSNAYYGPKVNISIVNPNNFSSNANLTESIQIMSENPSYLWPSGFSTIGSMTLPAQGNMTIFNKTFFPTLNGKTKYSGFLSYRNFFPIMAGWESYYHREGYKNGSTVQEVSLQVEATLSVMQNGNLSVYTYFNNLPFNPLSLSLFVEGGVPGITSNASSISAWFQGTNINPSSNSMISYIPFSFNLSPSYNLKLPTYTVKLNSSAQNFNAKASPYKIAPPPCYVGTKYIITNNTVIHGPLPLLSTRDTSIYPSANNYLSMAEGISTSTVELCMNSDQTGVSAGGTLSDQMSTNPSWVGNGTFTARGGITQVTVFPLGYPHTASSNGTQKPEPVNNTTAMIYIANTTITITHYKIYDVWENSLGQCMDTYLGNTTTMILNSIASNNSNFVLAASFVPIEYYYVMQNLTKNEPTTNLGNLPAGENIQGATIWGSTTGYSNGASVLAKTKKGLSTFAAGLGIALAVIDVLAAINAADGDTSEPSIVDTSLLAINSALALTNAVLTDFSTISFSTSSTFESDLYSIASLPNNSGYAYQLIDFQSSTTITFSVNGNTYSFYGPSNFVVAS